VDHARGRHYLPGDLLSRHGLAIEDFSASAGPEVQARCREVVAQCCQQARALMLLGAPLVHRIPGRAGWELRLVVQGGLRTLDKIEAIGFRTWVQRPALDSLDLPRLLWRALAMGFRPSDPGSATRN
jgi:hydroxysqualene synthase